MTEALRTGIILGLTLAVLIGPVFFALLQTSIQKGFIAAAMLALGIALSDSLYIVITNYFVSLFEGNETIRFFLGIFGGLLLVFIGIQTFLKKPRKKKEKVKTSKSQKAKLLLRGFLLNFAHPGVLLFWLGIVSLISTQWEFSKDEKIILYSSTIGTVLTTDMLKAFAAHKLSKFLTLNFLLWMNRVMGVVLTGFGIHLFVSTLLK